MAFVIPYFYNPFPLLITRKISALLLSGFLENLLIRILSGSKVWFPDNSIIMTWELSRNELQTQWIISSALEPAGDSDACPGLRTTIRDHPR